MEQDFLHYLPTEKIDEVPKIVSKLDCNFLHELFGGKHGLFATQLQAKFFQYACFVSDKKLSDLYYYSAIDLSLLCDDLGKILTRLGEVPLLAGSDGIWLSGSHIESVLSPNEAKLVFCKRLEELQIETMLVEGQVGIIMVKSICQKIYFTLTKLKNQFQ